MRLNTITFDANLPTTQQVNVPTNTDYKVGMKVKRNGEVQQLGPDEFTIYTGETTPGEPETITLNLSNQTEYYTGDDIMLFAAVSAGESGISALVGIELYANKVDFHSAGVEYGGNTYELDPQYVVVNDDMGKYKLSNGKWLDTDGNTYDAITIPSDAMLYVAIPSDDIASALGHTIPDNTNIKGTIDIIYTVKEGGDVPVTISADTEKINDYVTFTQASNDEANFRQLSVAVSVPAVPETVVKEEKNVVNTTGSRLTKQGVEISMEDHPELLGKAITPLNIIYNTAAGTGTTPPDLDTLEAEAVNVWSDSNPAYNIVTVAILINGDQMTVGDYYLVPPPASFRPQFIAQGAPADRPFFVKYELGSTGWHVAGYEAEHVLVEGDVVYPVRNNINNNASRGFVLKLMMGDAVPAWNANFKLNVNEFKSQSGDINVQTDPEFSTAKVEGTYADGTEFSFDFCVQ